MQLFAQMWQSDTRVISSQIPVYVCVCFQVSAGDVFEKRSKAHSKSNSKGLKKIKTVDLESKLDQNPPCLL